jgi:hypothetical protein
MKLTKVNGQQAEVRRLEWWEALTPGEQKFLCFVMRSIRAAKKSQQPEVAHAAAKWEITLACFIKVRLIGQAARGQRLTQKRKEAICITVGTFRRDAEMDPRDAGATASPSISRSPSDASPRQD